MSKKFAAAVLATLIGAGLTAPAFAADAVAPAGKTVEQAAPKAKHDGAKVENKAKHEAQTAKNKTEHAKPAAKDAAKDATKTPGKTL